MRLSDLRVEHVEYCDHAKAVCYAGTDNSRPATLSDLIAALIAEGGVTEEALVGDVEYHDEDMVRKFTVTTQLQPYGGPGRYLVFRLPEEEETE